MSIQRREGKSAPAHGARASPLPPLFIAFPPPGLSCVNWASQECCLFYLRSSLRSSDLPLFYFRGLFPSFSFSHRYFGLLFPILPANNLKPCLDWRGSFQEGLLTWLAVGPGWDVSVLFHVALHPPGLLFPI